MKKYLLQVSILLFIVVGLSSCGKYDEGPSLSLMSKVSRITGDWQIILQNSQTVSDVVVWSFNKDESFTRSYNGQANVNPAIWSFSADKEIIEVYYLNDDYTDYYNIIQLKNSSIILEIDNSGTITRYEFEAAK
ncbi:MAG: hypothetical protein HN691_12710 [Bacteroidetes bacterium]|nr:hypothetical protein [Bacteroidota bacterium]